MGSQRITSKVSNSGIFTVSPVKDTLQAKYATLTTKIKERFDTLGVTYSGIQQTGGLVSTPPLGGWGANPLGGWGAAVYFYHSDHLGSSSLITDATGALVQHVEYVPFGETFIDERRSASSWTTPYLFNAKERDEETGLYYYHARYYDSKRSVWLSVDPLAEKYPNISSYVYCANNPVRYIDPTGMGSEDGTYKMTNIEAGKKYGAIAILPLDLSDATMKARYNEAINNNLSIIQVKDRNALATAMKDLKDMKSSTNSYIIVQHGGPGSLRIGNERLTKENSTNKNLSMLRDGFKGKNIILTHCNITKDSNKNGTDLVRLFGKLTGANAVLSNDHLGFGIMNLNGSEKGYWSLTKHIPFVRREKGDGQYFNDFHLYLNGVVSPNPMQVYNAKLNFNTGTIIFNPMDNVTTGKRTY